MEHRDWTFFGHWEGGHIVVEFYLPGQVEDERVDTGYWSEGLWAASASGATIVEAEAAAVAEYENANGAEAAAVSDAPVVARRVTVYQAKRHFDGGGKVLVSEYGHKLTQTVYPQTTTHNRETITWASLIDQVREWRGRYPNQRFYIVGESAAV